MRAGIHHFDAQTAGGSLKGLVYFALDKLPSTSVISNLILAHQQICDSAQFFEIFTDLCVVILGS